MRKEEILIKSTIDVSKPPSLFYKSNIEEKRPHIFACCSVDKEELLKHSLINYINIIAKANLKIFHGKCDGLVPFTQSVDLYNRIIQKHPSVSVYLDIFDDAHQIDMNTAEYRISSQYKKSELTQVNA